MQSIGDFLSLLFFSRFAKTYPVWMDDKIKQAIQHSRWIGVYLMQYKDIITIEPGKRGSKPCIRGMRITVYDVLEYLASGMSAQEILQDFPYLTKDDILASLSFAAARERLMAVVQS